MAIAGGHANQWKPGAGRKVQDRRTLFFRVVMSILTGEKTPVELEWLRAAGQAINARLQVVVRRTWQGGPSGAIRRLACSAQVQHRGSDKNRAEDNSDCNRSHFSAYYSDGTGWQVQRRRTSRTGARFT